jgi:leucyl aminopeptidase
MHVTATTSAPLDTSADTIAVGVFEDEGIAHDVEDGSLTAMLDAGEARRRFRHVSVAHAAGRRWLVVGLGARNRFDPERARVAAAVAFGRAKEVGCSTLCWELPHHVDADVAGGFVEGTLLASYRFTRYKKNGDDDAGPEPGELIVSDHHDVSEPVRHAVAVAEAQNAARDLQNTPANDMTPSALAGRARELAGEIDRLTVTVEGREQIVERGMGAFAAVAQGTYEEPQLIVLRYHGAPGGEAGRRPVLGFVGKAVTFDSGGISIKPAQKMSDMKFDMSGGAAVIEAVGAIARLGLPVDVVAVVGATENLPSGRSVKPGDIVTAMNGTTIEVINTDAEGRLVLADCLAHAIALGAERVVDIATLTGAIVTALGSTYCGLMGNDDDWLEAVEDAATRSGEIAWRLPFHEEYGELIKGQYGEIINAVENRKAGSITAAEFLRRFVGDVPWAHLDIAGTAWDSGKPYAPKGGRGFGVRLLVELARAHVRAPAPAT